MAGLKEVQIEETFYDVDICFLIGGTIEELNLLMHSRYKDFEDHEDDADGLQWEQGGTFYVWMKEPSWNIFGHEVLHLVFDILKSRGISYHEDSDDVQAFLQGKIMELAGPRLGIC